MAEIIDIKDLHFARRQSRERVNLEKAVDLIRHNLALAANQLRDAPAAEQMELLGRVEKLSAMLRYGLLMLGDRSPQPDWDRHAGA